MPFSSIVPPSFHRNINVRSIENLNIVRHIVRICKAVEQHEPHTVIIKLKQPYFIEFRFACIGSKLVQPELCRIMTNVYIGVVKLGSGSVT
jgi:hypothetical protein